MPIILAAMPTQPLRFVSSVSFKSCATAKSASVFSASTDGLAQKWDRRHDFTLHVVLPLAGSFAGLPTLYGVIVRRRTAMERMTGSRLSIYEMSHGDFEMWDRNRRNMLGTMDDMPQYRKYMTQALELAHKGAGWVNPNPLVGMVVVRDGEILVAGYHDRYRGPHAERMAFDYADKHGIDMHGSHGVIDTPRTLLPWSDRSGMHRSNSFRTA